MLSEQSLYLPVVGGPQHVLQLILVQHVLQRDEDPIGYPVMERQVRLPPLSAGAET